MSIETWDHVGYALLAVFGLWVAFGDPQGMIFMLIFGFFAFLIWSSRDRTK